MRERDGDRSRLRARVELLIHVHEVGRGVLEAQGPEKLVFQRK